MHPNYFPLDLSANKHLKACQLLITCKFSFLCANKDIDILSANPFLALNERLLMEHLCVEVSIGELSRVITSLFSVNVHAASLRKKKIKWK